MSCSYSDIAMAGHDSKALVYDFCAGTLIQLWQDMIGKP